MMNWRVKMHMTYVSVCVWILQLRARSKAAEAGLMEGDEILAVNGYSCKDVSYERLIGLVEHAGHYLDLDIIRYVITLAHIFIMPDLHREETLCMQ